MPPELVQRLLMSQLSQGGTRHEGPSWEAGPPPFDKEVWKRWCRQAWQRLCDRDTRRRSKLITHHPAHAT